MPEAARPGFCLIRSLRAAKGLAGVDDGLSPLFARDRGSFVCDVALSCDDRLAQMCCHSVAVVVMAVLEKPISLLTYEEAVVEQK